MILQNTKLSKLKYLYFCTSYKMYVVMSFYLTHCFDGFFFCSSNCMCEVEMQHMYNISILNERRLDQRSPTSEANGTFITNNVNMYKIPIVAFSDSTICFMFRARQCRNKSAHARQYRNKSAALDSVEINLCLYIHLEMPIHGKPRRLLS